MIIYCDRHHQQFSCVKINVRWLRNVSFKSKPAKLALLRINLNFSMHKRIYLKKFEIRVFTNVRGLVQ